MEQPKQNIFEFSYNYYTSLLKIAGKSKLIQQNLYLIMPEFIWQMEWKDCEPIWNLKSILFQPTYLSWHLWKLYLALVKDISKRQILKQSSGKPINFGKPSGKRAVMDSLKSLSVEIWIKIWARFIRIAKRCVPYFLNPPLPRGRGGSFLNFFKIFFRKMNPSPSLNKK